MAFPIGRPKRGTIPEEEEQRVARAYQNGCSLRDIAYEYNVTVHEARKVLKNYDVKIRKRGRVSDEEFKQRLLRSLRVQNNGRQ